MGKNAPEDWRAQQKITTETATEQYPRNTKRMQLYNCFRLFNLSRPVVGSIFQIFPNHYGFYGLLKIFNLIYLLCCVCLRFSFFFLFCGITKNTTWKGALLFVSIWMKTAKNCWRQCSLYPMHKHHLKASKKSGKNVATVAALVFSFVAKSCLLIVPTANIQKCFNLSQFTLDCHKINKQRQQQHKIHTHNVIVKCLLQLFVHLIYRH